MKILHVIPSVSPLRGGPSFVVQAMARGVARQGCEVHIATTDDDGPGRLSVPLGRPVAADGITYWYFPRQIRFYTFSWPLFRWLSRYAGEYDVIHIHALFSFPVIPAAYWASRRGVPYVIRPLGTLSDWGVRNRRPLLKRISLRVIDRPALAHAAAVHYTSEQERVEASALIPGGASVIIPNPVDFRCNGAAGTDWLGARHPELAGRRVVLFLSRLDRKKGIDLLLRAFAQLRSCGNTGLALVLGGNGDEAFVGELRDLAARLGIAGDVVWAGFVEGEQKKALLSAARVFVLPSYSENFGVAVAEAMMCGVPVIVSDQVGIHAEISSAGAGIVVPCEPGAIAGAIQSVLEHDELRARLSQNGRALANSFTVEAVAERLMDLYRRLAPQAGAAAC